MVSDIMLKTEVVTDFVISLIGAVSDQVKVKKAVKTAPKVLETELGIKYIELKKGSGAFPTPNDFVIINYRYSSPDRT